MGSVKGDSCAAVRVVAAVMIDEGMVSQLAGMGFDLEGCKKAVYFTHNQGTTVTLSQKYSVLLLSVLLCVCVFCVLLCVCVCVCLCCVCLCTVCECVCVLLCVCVCLHYVCMCVCVNILCVE